VFLSVGGLCFRSDCRYCFRFVNEVEAYSVRGVDGVVAGSKIVVGENCRYESTAGVCGLSEIAFLGGFLLYSSEKVPNYVVDLCSYSVGAEYAVDFVNCCGGGAPRGSSANRECVVVSKLL
jgi:hypothetical protein